MTSTKEKSKSSSSSITDDEVVLNRFGYEQTLHRTWKQFENFAASFGSLYFVGGVRYLYYLGIYSGGPAALWSSFLITMIFMTITAAVLAEICSALPLSGSIYIWAAEAAGPRWGRLSGFIVAFWATTAWTSFVASNTLGIANFILTELVVFENYFPGGITTDNVKFRAVVWIVSEGLLALMIISNVISPKTMSWIFRLSVGIILLDFLLTMIWLPIGVSQTYGFQSAKWVFTKGFNGTGASPGWNWILSFLSTSSVLTGFDASGHIAEETKNAGVVAARGLFWGCVASALGAFPVLILFLFCSPDLDVLFGLEAPQPFVLIYELALGRGGQVVMTTIVCLGLLINSSVAVVAASRLIYAIARDGVLPGSRWIGRVDKNGNPSNSVYFIWFIAAILLCTSLPSQVAFTSLVSAAAVPTIAAYALIPILRLLFTPHNFSKGKWSLGKYSKPFCVIAAIWNLFLMCVLLSPYSFPVTAETFNFSSAIFGAVTIFGLLAYWLTPEEMWLRKELVGKMWKETRDASVQDEIGEVEGTGAEAVKAKET